MQRFLVAVVLGVGCGCGPAATQKAVPTTEAPAKSQAEAPLPAAGVDPELRGKWQYRAVDSELPQEWSARLLFDQKAADSPPAFGTDETLLEVTEKEFKFGTKKLRVAAATTDPARTPKAIDLKLDSGQIVRGSYQVKGGNFMLVLSSEPTRITLFPDAQFNFNPPGEGVAIQYVPAAK